MTSQTSYIADLSMPVNTGPIVTMKKRNLPCAAIKYVKDTLEQLMKDIVIANSPKITPGRIWGTNTKVLPIQTKIENLKIYSINITKMS